MFIDDVHHIYGWCASRFMDDVHCVDRNVAFFAGSVLAVLVVLTVIDEDVLAVEHVLTTMTVAGVLILNP
jgi:hypothetical protein